MKVTHQAIQDIFYSGTHVFNGEQEVISEIKFLINEGYLKLQKFALAKKNDYFDIIDSLQDNEHKQYSASGGSISHVALKILAGKHLEQVHKLSYKYEQPFCGYYPDVISNDKSIVIECGHTQNPEKVLCYFQHGNISECVQIPYSDMDDEEITGYSFLANKDLQEFLDLLSKEKLSNAKLLIQNR